MSQDSEALDIKGMRDLLRYLGGVLPAIETKAQKLYPRAELPHWTEWPKDVLALFPDDDETMGDIYGYLAGLLIGFGEYFKEAAGTLKLPSPPRAKAKPKKAKAAPPPKKKTPRKTKAAPPKTSKKPSTPKKKKKSALAK